MKLELSFETTRDEHGVFDGRALAEHMIWTAYQLLTPYVNHCPACADNLFTVIANKAIEKAPRDSEGHPSGSLYATGEGEVRQKAEAAHLEAAHDSILENILLRLRKLPPIRASPVRFLQTRSLGADQRLHSAASTILPNLRHPPIFHARLAGQRGLTMAEGTKQTARERASFARAERLKKEAAAQVEAQRDTGQKQETERKADRQEKQQQGVEQRKADQARKQDQQKADERRKADQKQADQKKQDAARLDARQQEQRKQEAQKRADERRAEAHVAAQFKQQQADQIAEHRRQTSRLRAQHREQSTSLKGREGEAIDRHRHDIKTIDDRERQALKDFDVKRRQPDRPRRRAGQGQGGISTGGGKRCKRNSNPTGSTSTAILRR